MNSIEDTDLLPATRSDATECHPPGGTPEAWNSACGRVDHYLRAHRIPDAAQRERLTRTILERAVARGAIEPGLDPTALAVREAEAVMENWFAGVRGAEGSAPERATVNGRVALVLGAGLRNWPGVFLESENLPEDFVRAMRAPIVRAAPDLAMSRMVMRPLELGVITEAAGETIKRIEQWPILRALLVGLLFFGALAAIF